MVDFKEALERIDQRLRAVDSDVDEANERDLLAKRAAKLAQRSVTTTASSLQYRLSCIAARQGTLRFAVPSENVRRVVDVTWSPVDGAPPKVLGWFIFGTEPIALIRLLDEGVPDPRVKARVMLLQTSRGPLALLCDVIEGATDIDLLRVKRASGTTALPFIFGHSHDLISIIDVEALGRWNDIETGGR